MTTRRGYKQTKNQEIIAPAIGDGSVLPVDLNMERAFLGFCLTDPDVISETQDIIQASDFSFKKYAEVFEVFLELYSSQELAADVNLLSRVLVAKGVFPDLMSAREFINKDLLNIEVVSNHMYAVRYAEDLRSMATQRNLIKLSWEIPSLIKTMDSQPISEIMGAVEAKVFDVTQKSRDKKTGLVEVSQCLSMLESRLESLGQGEVVANGLSTGIDSLDRIISGLRPSELIILAARPAVGKSAVSLNIAYHVAAMSRQPVAFFSLEMSKESLADRLISSIARVNIPSFNQLYYRLNDGGFDNPATREKVKKRLINETKRLIMATEHIRKVPLLIDDSATQTVMSVASATRRLYSDAVRKYNAPLGLIIIDYLQLMQPTIPRANRQEEVAEISRALKKLAKEFGVPILALSQLSRQVETRTNKRPVLADLRESGAIEQDADIVMFIFRPHAGEPIAEGETEESLAVKKMKGEIIVGKHRAGPIGDAQVIIDDNFTLFRSIPAKVRALGIDAYIAEFWRKVHIEGDLFFTVPDNEIPPELMEYKTKSSQSVAQPTPINIANELGFNEPESIIDTPENKSKQDINNKKERNEDYFDNLVKTKSRSSLLQDFLDDDNDDELDDINEITLIENE